MQKVYTTYEEPFTVGSFTEDGMRDIYFDMVDQNEYPSFNDWLYDMTKSGVFEVDELPETLEEQMHYNGLSWSDFI